MIEVITQYFKVKYNDKQMTINRQNEINECLKQNINNKFVNKIHFLYESDEDYEYFKNLITDKVIMYPLKKRITYQDVLKYANNNLEDKICVYLHADMHITDDFGKLKNYDKKTVYALTSHHPKKCNKKLHCKCTRQFKTEKGIYGVTFDGFVFMPQIPDAIIKKTDYEVNHMGAENRFIYLFKSNGYNVVCPNEKLRAIHRHNVVFHNRKAWISIDGSFKPLKYYSKIHHRQKNKKFQDRIVGGGIPFYLGSAKFI